jgi:hypothetical protein
MEPKELTVRGLILGSLLTLVFTAADRLSCVRRDRLWASL